jgi:hypothetical protein
MKHKVPWLITGAVVLVAAVMLVRSGGASPFGEALAGAESRELRERLAQVEARLPEVERSPARTGAQLATAVLAHAATGPAAPAPDTSPEAAARLAAREIARYDRFDMEARAGGGADLAARLRSNLERHRKEFGSRAPALDIAALDCNEALCRVEVRYQGHISEVTRAATTLLVPGMGNASMRPAAPGQPAVIYMAAPGTRLPPLEP